MASTWNVARPANLWRMGVLWLLALIISYIKLAFRLLTKSVVQFPRRSLRSRSSRACIVTGASSGIGKATAEALALEGYHVILAARSPSRLSEVVTEIQGRQENAKLYPLELDLCSINSILKFVDAVGRCLNLQAPEVSLQLIVNNAGILSASQKWTTDGYDSMMMSNFFGPYILTKLLLPLLKSNSQPSRIVNVVSFTHRCVTDLQVGQELLTKGRVLASTSSGSYPMARIYEASKLCLLLFTYELNRQLWNAGFHQISVMAADPGAVKTNILRECPLWLVKLAEFLLASLSLLQSPASGSKAVLDAALASVDSCKYFFGGNGYTCLSSQLSYDVALSKSLWELSESLYELALAENKFYNSL